MRKSAPAADPDAYVHALDGWRRTCVAMLRGAMHKVAGLEETVKWGHLVYSANGPVLLIRAEDERVLLGFWRGLRLREVEPRLKPGGKYEMATFDIREGVAIKPAVVSRLVRQAVVLNKKVGDPTKAAAARTKNGDARKRAPRSTRRRQSNRT